MSSTIAIFLAQDGIINGAIYALLGVTLVLVFAVTRVIFVPQGEFVAWGALTLAAFEAGSVPGTAGLLVTLGCAAASLDMIRARFQCSLQTLVIMLLRDIVAPLALFFVIKYLAPSKPPMGVSIALTLALITPMGPLVYRLAFQPLADASVLTLFIAAIGVHFALTGLGLFFFGAEGFRTLPLIADNFKLGALILKGQSIGIVAVTALLLVMLYLFFENTLLGKALRATAVNRLGARLVGIPVYATGWMAFSLATFIGAMSGMMVGALSTIYYDSGFLLGLKGFVAAIAAGLASYPLTVLAALAVGLLESFSAFFASAFKEVIVFSVIIPLLIWRSLRAPKHDEEE